MPRHASTNTPGAVNTAATVLPTLGVAEEGAGNVHVTTLFLDKTPVTIVGASGVGFGGVKLYDFPKGRILILGVTASLGFEIISTEGDLALTADGDWSVGSVIANDGTLDSTHVDIVPKTATTSNDLDTAVGAALASSAQFDGTTTALDAFLNVTIDDAETDETSILGANGNVTITWVDLGTY